MAEPEFRVVRGGGRGDGVPQVGLCTSTRPALGTLGLGPDRGKEMGDRAWGTGPAAGRTDCRTGHPAPAGCDWGHSALYRQSRYVRSLLGGRSKEGSAYGSQISLSGV